MRIALFTLCASSFWLRSSCLQPPMKQERSRRSSQPTAPVSDAFSYENAENVEPDSTISRRYLFQSACASLSALANPFSANAAAPITAAEADNFSAKAQRLLRPKPPKALRPKLNRDFAVLLMRSSYNALDLLDCVAMVRPNTFLFAVLALYHSR